MPLFLYHDIPMTIPLQNLVVLHLPDVGDHEKEGGNMLFEGPVEVEDHITAFTARASQGGQLAISPST